MLQSELSEAVVMMKRVKSYHRRTHVLFKIKNLEQEKLLSLIPFGIIEVLVGYLYNSEYETEQIVDVTCIISYIFDCKIPSSYYKQADEKIEAMMAKHKLKDEPLLELREFLKKSMTHLEEQKKPEPEYIIIDDDE
ncbi:developmentally-regulated external PM-anchored protein [Acrasis kona]|uniref:Developmentally-regulated external PM-anchored protein n=1 Tax=Acrasis kona TaxID=1008807 RepID=A0AAW2YPC8_9EUKA